MSARIGDGEVFDSAKLKNTVRFLIENDMRNVVIDLGNLEYLYSDTINAFIASNRHMLEVSGRIAILTEHPKVQDILKRAGLDNIMRIYRSEAEMIADSKEILRQTSSYRIEELQKISTQPQGEMAPAPSPRTEFDDFKMEMGQRLGSKLDNNEVPQYQLGVTPSAAPAGFGAPPARETPAYPTFNQPGFTAPPPQSVPGQGQPGYVPSQPAPAFGSFNNAPAYGVGGASNGTANGAPAFGGAPASGFGGGPAAPSNFDFPTVQLPVGGFGGNTQPMAAAPASPTRETPVDPSAPGYGQGDAGDSDPRSRKPSQERMRSPNARRQQGRRVGGREFPGGLDEGPDTGAYVDERAPEIQPPAEAYGGYVPPAAPNSLMEESKSPGKLILFVLVLALVGGAVFWALSRGDSEEHAIPDVPAAPPAPEPTVVTPPAVPEGAKDPTAVAPAAPATPVTPSAPAAPAAPVATPEPTVAKPAAPAVPEKPKPEPKVARTPPAPAKRPKPEPRAERPAKAPVVADEPDDEPPAVAQGKLRITSTPSGAEVLVNFSKKGVTPTDISLLNNSNKIIVRLPGYKRFETTVPKNHPDRELDVTLEREGDEEVAKTPEPEAPRSKAPVKPLPEDEPDEKDPYEELPLKPEPRKPEIGKQDPPKARPEASPTPGDGPIGVIFLSSSPARADIIIDGKNTGKKTPAKVELPSGQHRIEMVKSGQRAVVDQPVNEGKNKALHLNLQ